MTSYVPVGLTPVGAFSPGAGATRGLIIRCHEDTVVDGIHTPVSSGVIAKARIYSISGGGGGDGTLKVDLTDVATNADGDIVFGAPVTLLHDVAYGVQVLLTGSQTFGAVNNGGAPIDQDPRYTANEWWGLYTTDGTLPSTANITTGNTVDPPFDQVQNYYGVGLRWSALPSKIVATRSRVDDTHISLDWTIPGDAPDGVSFFRCPGNHTGVDGEGRAPSDPAYDCTTIEGAELVAEGLTEGPYVDELPEPGTYTYWPVRTGL